MIGREDHRVASQSTVKIVASTSAIISVMVNGELVVKSARTPVVIAVMDGADNLMSWEVEGDPGAEYTITLSSDDANVKIETSPAGLNPVKSSISTHLLRGGGQVHFQTSKKS